MLRKIGTIISLIAGIGMIAVGVMNSQYADVFTKATRICMECIGIG